MDIFKGQSLLDFSDRFKIAGDCKEYLALIKAKPAYKCLKYSHVICQKRTDLSNECNICRHIESPRANTLFRKVKFGVQKAFLYVLKYQQVPKNYQLAIRQIAMMLQKKRLVYSC
jgi:hypothetical protein